MGNTIIRKLLIFIAAFLLWYFAAFLFLGQVESAQAPVIPQEPPKKVLEEEIEAPKETTEQMIVRKAKEYGLDPVKALRVAKCESGLNPLAKNPSSTATGIYQFLDSTWSSVNRLRKNGWMMADRLSTEKNVDNAMWLAKMEGWHHWVCQ